MIRTVFAAVLLALASSGALAQAAGELQLDGAVGGCRLDGGERLPGERSRRFELPPGEHRLDFVAAAGGKPASLVIEVPPTAVAHVAVDRGPAPDRAPVPLGRDAFAPGAGWQQRDAGIVTTAADGTPCLRLGDSPPDYVVHARVSGRGAPALGLLARASAADQHYRLVWLPATGRLQLVRQMGAQALVLAEAPAPAGERHELALQVHGFRLQAFCDDVVVAQVMDGAHGSGGCGLYAAAGAQAAFDDVAFEPPWSTTSVLATVVTGEGAQIVGRAPAFATGGYCLGLRLDQATGPRLGSDGLEPFFCSRGAAPVFLLGVEAAGALRDLRGSFGARGEVQAALQWPRTPVLRGRVALVAGYAIDQEGSQVLGLLPGARLVF